MASLKDTKWSGGYQLQGDAASGEGGYHGNTASGEQSGYHGEAVSDERSGHHGGAVSGESGSHANVSSTEKTSFTQGSIDSVLDDKEDDDHTQS